MPPVIRLFLASVLGVASGCAVLGLARDAVLGLLFLTAAGAAAAVVGLRPAALVAACFGFALSYPLSVVLGFVPFLGDNVFVPIALGVIAIAFGFALAWQLLRRSIPGV